MAYESLEREKQYVENELQKNGLKHLKVSKRGMNLVIYGEDENGKDNRCRFSCIKSGLFYLNIANHTGKWEQTPFEGTLEERLFMVIEQFPGTLTDYAQENIL